MRVCGRAYRAVERAQHVPIGSVPDGVPQVLCTEHEHHHVADGAAVTRRPIPEALKIASPPDRRRSPTEDSHQAYGQKLVALGTRMPYGAPAVVRRASSCVFVALARKLMRQPLSSAARPERSQSTYAWLAWSD